MNPTSQNPAPTPPRPTGLSGWRGRLAALGVLVAAGASLGAISGGGEPAVEEPALEPGVVRAAGRPGDPLLGVEGFLALEHRLAEERRARVQGMLDRLWPGRAFVTVGVELDPRWVTSAERIQPDLPAVKEDEQPASGASGGRRRTYEPFSGERRTTLLAPEIRRVSAALVLDVGIARDPRQQQRIVETVKKALGAVRGEDADVEVLLESLAGPVSPSAPKPVPVVRSRPTGDFLVLTASIALAALGMAWYWLRRPRRSRDVAEPEPVIADEPPPAQAARARRRAIEDAITGDPVFASRLVESWMAEGRT